MTLPIRKSLGLLAGELHVDISDLDDEQMEQVALRFLEARNINAEVLRSIIEDVREQAQGGTSPLASVPSAEPGTPAGYLLSPPGDAHPAPRSHDCCTPIKMPYPSGWWVVHSKFCPETPGAKMHRLGHPAGTKRKDRLPTVHAAEDARAAVIPMRRVRSCDKCGEQTTRFPYCDECRVVLDIVGGRA